MHQAVNVQLERIVREFAQWRAVPEGERSPAPAWWWGPAFEVRGVQQPMPADWCARLELPGNSSLARRCRDVPRRAGRPDLAAMARRVSAPGKAFESGLARLLKSKTVQGSFSGQPS